MLRKRCKASTLYTRRFALTNWFKTLLTAIISSIFLAEKVCLNGYNICDIDGTRYFDQGS